MSRSHHLSLHPREPNLPRGQTVRTLKILCLFFGSPKSFNVRFCAQLQVHHLTGCSFGALSSYKSAGQRETICLGWKKECQKHETNDSSVQTWVEMSASGKTQWNTAGWVDSAEAGPKESLDVLRTRHTLVGHYVGDRREQGL